MFVTRAFKRFLAVVIVYLILAIFLLNTDPHRLPLILLIVPFGLIFVGLLLPILFLSERPSTLNSSSRQKRLLVAGCLAGLPTVLLLLSSINQLTVKDVLLLAILVLLTVFYLKRVNALQR
jgi:hypothetical protein